MSGGRFFNKNRYNDTSLKGAWRSAIIAICDAAERFSETKTGALIVLERNTNLSEIVRTGTPVNSAVNLEVLGTIFYEGTSFSSFTFIRIRAPSNTTNIV